MPTRAEEIIDLQKREEAGQGNFRSLWQDTADNEYPQQNDITSTLTPGTARTTTLYDTTAVFDAKIASDGLLSAIIPAGELFFKLNAPSDRIGGQSEEQEEYLTVATEKLHTALFDSNFLLQIARTLRSLVVFGTGNLFSEWTVKAGLNFKDWPIGRYQMLENSEGHIDTMIVKFQFTARQAVQEWGEKNVGKDIMEAYNSEKDQNKLFWFVHLVRPREERNRVLTDNLNMPFESVYVGVKEKIIIDEGGFPEFPYHTPRWEQISGEVYGRGIGTEILPQVKVVNQQAKDLIECGNKWNNPPREILDTFEGDVNVVPGANNYVQVMNSIKAIDDGVRGNFPITKESLEMEREVIDKAFYKNVFTPLVDLKGDRRNELEIRERIIEGLRQVGQPAYRTQNELLKTVIERSLSLMIRNGVLPRPPAGLKTYQIEYLGLMANALSSGQSKAFERWASAGMEMEEAFPGTKDNVNVDEGYRDLGRSLGVKAEHIASMDDVEVKREATAAALARQQQLELLQAGAQGYGQTTKAPEEGSLAEVVTGA